MDLWRDRIIEKFLHFPILPGPRTPEHATSGSPWLWVICFLVVGGRVGHCIWPPLRRSLRWSESYPVHLTPPIHSSRRSRYWEDNRERRLIIIDIILNLSVRNPRFDFTCEISRAPFIPSSFKPFYIYVFPLYIEKNIESIIHNEFVM